MLEVKSMDLKVFERDSKHSRINFESITRSRPVMHVEARHAMVSYTPLPQLYDRTGQA